MTRLQMLKAIRQDKRLTEIFFRVYQEFGRLINIPTEILTEIINYSDEYVIAE